MGKKKSGGLSGTDYFAMFFGLLGPLTCLFAGLLMPMRMAKSVGDISWPMRWYYILDATDQGTMRSAKYKMLRLEICQKFDLAQQQYGNPTGMLMAEFMANGPLKAVTALVPMCDMKPSCREHLSARCIWYEYLYFDGMCYFGANFMSLCQFGLAAIIIIILRKRAYRWYAMVISLSGTFMSACAILYWVNDSNYYLREMALQTVWPYAPFNASGSKIVGAGILFQLLSSFFCFLSSRPITEKVDVPRGLHGQMPMGGMPPR